METELVKGYERVCASDLNDRIENEMDIPNRYFLSEDGIIYAEIVGRNPVSIFDTSGGGYTHN